MGCAVVADAHGGAPAPGALKHPRLLKSLGEGVVFVFRHRLLLGAMSLDLFAVLFGGAVALLPVFASDILQGGPPGPRPAAHRPGGWVPCSWACGWPTTRRGTGRAWCCWPAWPVFGLCWIGFALS